jgi:hypothetical protein
MKITVTKEFGSPEEAAAWLRIFSGEPTPFVVPEPIRVDATGAASNEPTPPAPGKKPRKPRADAGKPRGPYKTTGGPAASTPADQADVAASSAAAPASPTQSAAPAVAHTDGVGPATAEAVNSGSGATPPAAADPDKAPTIDDARAALKRINDTPGLGMEACMTHMADFGTNRVLLLKPEQYPSFIKSADEKVAAAKAAAARDAKVK